MDQVKVRLSLPSRKICFICFKESPLKMMNNAFYSALKALFVLKILKFLSWLFGCIEKNDLTWKARLISKVMTSQTGSQTIAVHILSNISQNKGNQTMKFENKIFFQKSCRRWGKETSSRPPFVFWKSFIWGKSKWSSVSCKCILTVLNLAYNKFKTS